jgi:hypothetical protein
MPTRDQIETALSLEGGTVTDREIEVATTQIHYEMGCTVTAARNCAMRALTAAAQVRQQPAAEAATLANELSNFPQRQPGCTVPVELICRTIAYLRAAPPPQAEGMGEEELTALIEGHVGVWAKDIRKDLQLIPTAARQDIRELARAILSRLRTPPADRAAPLIHVGRDGHAHSGARAECVACTGSTAGHD